MFPSTTGTGNAPPRTTPTTVSSYNVATTIYGNSGAMGRKLSSSNKKRRGSMLQGKARSSLRTKQYYTSGMITYDAVDVRHHSPASGATSSADGPYSSHAHQSTQSATSVPVPPPATHTATHTLLSAALLHPLPAHYFSQPQPLSRSSSFTSSSASHLNHGNSNRSCTPGKSILRTPSRPNTPHSDTDTPGGGERRVRWWDDSH